MLRRDRDLGRALMVFAIDPEGQQTELFEDVAFGIRQIWVWVLAVIAITS